MVEADEDDTGDCIACWEGHASKNVWSCAINPEHQIVATGGQDSGIRLWSLASIRNNKIDSEEDLIALPLAADRGKDNIRNFVMIKNRWIVAATTEGYILKCDTTVLPREWVEVQHDDTYRNYAIMKNSECGRIVIVGNIIGDLVIISPTEAFRVSVFLYIKLNYFTEKLSFCSHLKFQLISKNCLKFLLKQPLTKISLMSFQMDTMIVSCFTD
jgi:WD40 repeat protein